MSALIEPKYHESVEERAQRGGSLNGLCGPVPRVFEAKSALGVLKRDFDAPPLSVVPENRGSSRSPLFFGDGSIADNLRGCLLLVHADGAQSSEQLRHASMSTDLSESFLDLE